MEPVKKSENKLEFYPIINLRPVRQTRFLPYTNWTIRGTVVGLQDLQIGKENYYEVLVADETGTIYLHFSEKSNLIELAKNLKLNKTYIFSNFYGQMAAFSGEPPTEMHVYPREEDIVINGDVIFPTALIKPIDFNYSRLYLKNNANRRLKCTLCSSDQVFLFNAYDKEIEHEPYYGCLKCLGRMLPEIEDIKPSKYIKHRTTAWSPSRAPVAPYVREMLRKRSQFPIYVTEKGETFEDLLRSSIEKLARLYDFLELGLRFEKKSKNEKPLANRILLHWPSDKFETFSDFLLAYEVFAFLEARSNEYNYMQ